MFAIVWHGPHDLADMPNDQLLTQQPDAITARLMRPLQTSLGRAVEAATCAKRCLAKQCLAKRCRRLADWRKNCNRQTTARLARDHAMIIPEDSSIANLIASARRTAQEPATTWLKTRDRTGQSSVPHPADGSLLTSKAEEADGRVMLVDLRTHGPSQTDPDDGSVRKKALSNRIHVLPDGQQIGRDQAAAWVLWHIGPCILGEEQARTGSSQTKARAA